MNPRRSLAIGLFSLALLAAARGEDRPLRQIVDAEIKNTQQEQKVTGAGLADDATFLRRVYLDLVGAIPTYEEARQFLADSGSDKRAKLIDRLLDDPRFGQHQANVWQVVLFGRNPAGTDAAKSLPAFNRWLAERFNKNEPYDRIVRAILSAEGSTSDDGTPLFYLQFNARAEETAMAVSRIFLGTQLQCAQCHDHPNDKWEQLDFYGFAGFFARLAVVEGGGKKMIAEKRTGEVLFTGPAAQQKPGQKGKPVPAKFLGGAVLEEPALPANFKEADLKGGKAPPKPDFSRRDKLLEWLTAGDNPYFARAAVNRLWGQLMGRGLIHPVDDLRDSREPSHPELALAMQKQFVAKSFDLKWLFRELVSSQTYQRAKAPQDGEAFWFERARLRPLSGEEMLVALRSATGFGNDKLPPGLAEAVLRNFGSSIDGRGEFQASMGERLFMNNSLHLREVIRRKKGNLADEVLASTAPWEERVERMYLTVLSRPPRPEEKQKFVAYLTSDAKSEPLVEEAIWVLLNCSEFRFNH